ncbi:hypothetical protein ANTPLA_LOCUS8931 [Anthophora plagiata]
MQSNGNHTLSWEELANILLNMLVPDDNTLNEIARQKQIRGSIEPPPPPDTHDAAPFESEEIESIVKGLKNNKAPGEDQIENEIIKVAWPYIKQPFTHLYNSKKKEERRRKKEERRRSQNPPPTFPTSQHAYIPTSITQTGLVYTSMSYPAKGSRETGSRTSRPSKRHFHGNQFIQKRNKDDGAGQSASVKKIHNKSSGDVSYNPLLCYRLIKFYTVFSGLAEILICHKCKSPVTFEQTGNRGFGFKLVVVCRCSRTEINSGPFVHNGFEVNRRHVFVMRLLGVARDGINLFASLMDICDGLSDASYNSIVKHMHSATKTILEFCCKKAVEEEKKENVKREKQLLNLKVSGDGSWKKRGFKSLYGVTTLIGYYSGKVIDLVMKSSYCQACTIRRNVNSVANMKNAIMATYYHLCSTNENPRHELCPTGEESWCTWKKAEALGTGTDTLNHPPTLHPDVQKHIFPIFEELSNEDLLQRCLGGHTQNANESFNSTVWRFAPKHLNSGLKIVEIGAFIASSIFNEGYFSILKVMQELQLIIGKEAMDYAEETNQRRIQRQERRSSLSTKEARKARRDQLAEQNEYFEEAEGLLYGAGIAD